MNAGSIRIMGIINVTPDSFSDGGLFAGHEEALRHAAKLIADGADIIDIGGESTRPYATPVSLDEELERVIPVITSLRAQADDITISIDTTKAEVARQALAAGADMINDVSALRHDPEMIEVLRQSAVPVIIMHMQGKPADMQIRPSYGDIVEEIVLFLRERLAWMERQGVSAARVIVDPGIGFGKTVRHNLTILNHLNEFAKLGRPVLLGHSRKRFLGEITGIEEERERDQATAIATALCAGKRIDIVRVHDVAATRTALQVARAIHDAA